MKILNSIQDLWNYCNFCPYCKEYCREVKVTIGPEYAISTISFSYSNFSLRLYCVLSGLDQIRFKFDINCIDNTFDYTGLIHDSSYDHVYVHDIQQYGVYFYMQGHCSKCRKASSFSKEMKFNYQENKIDNIGLEYDTIRYEYENSQYYLEVAYLEGITYIGLNHSNKYIKFPFIDFDFSDLEKLTFKIKTLILFS